MAGETFVPRTMEQYHALAAMLSSGSTLMVFDWRDGTVCPLVEALDGEVASSFGPSYEIPGFKWDPLRGSFLIDVTGEHIALISVTNAANRRYTYHTRDHRFDDKYDEDAHGPLPWLKIK